MGAEPNNYGLPQYQVDNLGATLEDLDATDAATLLAAYGHVQGICQAQVATAVNTRLRAIRDAAGSDTPSRTEGTHGPQEVEDVDVGRGRRVDIDDAAGHSAAYSAGRIEYLRHQLADHDGPVFGDGASPTNSSLWVASRKVSWQVRHGRWTQLHGEQGRERGSAPGSFL